MKKYIILAMAVVMMTACLDKEPQDFTSPSTWYSSQNELEMALATVYDPLRDVYSDITSAYICLKLRMRSFQKSLLLR